jgi:hypothetical protein
MRGSVQIYILLSLGFSIIHTASSSAIAIRAIRIIPETKCAFCFHTANIQLII